MFAYIKGSLEVKSINYVVVENGGIGYKIYMSAKSIGTIGNIGDQVKVKLTRVDKRSRQIDFKVI